MRHRDAFDPRVIVLSRERHLHPLGFFNERPSNNSHSRRNRPEVRNMEMEKYLDWRCQRLWEAYGDEIQSQDTEDTLNMHFRHLAQWLTCVELA
jgi:hypothetical protein